MKKKVNVEEDDNTYSGEGMMYGVAAGSLIGAIFTSKGNVVFLPICMSLGMVIGLAIGSCIKKKSKGD